VVSMHCPGFIRLRIFWIAALGPQHVSNRIPVIFSLWRGNSTRLTRMTIDRNHLRHFDWEPLAQT